MPRIALIFDNKVRPDTTGMYCRRGLAPLADVHHYLPSEADRIPRTGFDLYLFIDDGLRHPIPADLRPAAWWAIDTHLDFDWGLEQSRRADVVFAAQRDGAERLQAEGIEQALWLPLACDPATHRPLDLPKIHDLCFVGHLFPGPRSELVELLQSRFAQTFVGQRFFKEMAATYAESRIVFNRSLQNDINMRVFEALGCGGFLLTNDLAGNGQSELFRDGVHLATYGSAEELLEKATFYLENESLRKKIAAAGHAEAIARHTYSHRMQTLLEAVERRLSRHTAPVLGKAEHQPSVGPRPEKHPAGNLTSIILVTFNQLDYTRLCIDSVLAHTKTPFELVCVDNGSTDGTVDYFRSLPGVTVIANPDNRGFPAAANQGIQAARGEQILLLNNDTVVTPGWLDRMLAAFERDPQVGLVGPCSNYCSGPQEIAVPYDRLDQIDPFAQEWARVNAGQTLDLDRLVGFCLLFRRSVVDRIGLLDERFGIGNFEDDDFCRRAITAGFRTLVALDSFIHHFGSRTFFGSGVDLGQLLEENERKYEAKWATRSSPNGSSSKGIASETSQPVSSPANGNASELAPFEFEAREGGGLLLRHRKVRLSLCMIVRDNETTIGPALKSIRPWVDEIIVVDTGSTDRTPAICRDHGARLHQFPWCDDFSAARNESIKYARGEWIFWMDSDDTISEDCGRRLRILADGSHDPPVLGYIMQVHCPGPSREPSGGEDVTVVDHVKLFRNRPDLKFEGRIHEQLLPAIRRAGGDVAWTDLHVVHSGSDHSAAGWERKVERDLRILHQELKERPGHPFVLFNLGMTYADARRYGDAVDFLERCLAVSRPEESHLRKAYSLLVSALSQAERQDEAWRRCEEGLALYPDDKELLFRSGILHHHFGRLEAAEAAYLRVLNDSGERHFQSIDQGLAGYKARHNLALVFDDLGRLEAVEAEWRRILEDCPNYVPAWRGLGDALLRQQKLPEVEFEISRLLAGKNGLKREAFLLRGRLLAAQERIPAAIAELDAADALDPTDLEPLRTKCRVLFERGTIPDAEAALQELIRRAPDDAAAHHNLGTICWQRKDFPAAIAAYRRSLQVRPDSVSTRLQLGHALRESGNSTDARREWQHAFELDPANNDVRAALAAV